MDNWSSVFTTDKLYQAELVKEKLDENSIESVILDQQNSSFLIGDISVMVNNNDAKKAEEVIKKIDL